MLLCTQWSKNRFVLHVVRVMMGAQFVNTDSSPLFDPQGRDDKVIVFKYKKKKKYQRKLGHRQVCFQLHSSFPKERWKYNDKYLIAFCILNSRTN